MLTEAEGDELVDALRQRLAQERGVIHRPTGPYVPSRDGIDARGAAGSRWHAVTTVSTLELRALAVWALAMDDHITRTTTGEDHAQQNQDARQQPAGAADA